MFLAAAAIGSAPVVRMKIDEKQAGDKKQSTQRAHLAEAHLVHGHEHGALVVHELAAHRQLAVRGLEELVVHQDLVA